MFYDNHEQLRHFCCTSFTTHLVYRLPSLHQSIITGKYDHYIAIRIQECRKCNSCHLSLICTYTRTGVFYQTQGARDPQIYITRSHTRRYFEFTMGKNLGEFGLVTDKYRNCSKTKIRVYCQMMAQSHPVFIADALRRATRQKLAQNYAPFWVCWIPQNVSPW